MLPVPSSRSILETAVGRRTTIGLGLGVVSLLAGTASGCDLDDLTGAAPAGGSAGGDAPPDDPDRAVLDGVLADLDARLAAVVAARAALPRLRRTLKPLEQMHRAHRAVLDPDPAVPTTTPAAPPVPAAPATPATPAGTLESVRAGETAHQAALVAAAVACHSGALARLLASVSASVTQHLAVLPTEVARR